MKKKFTLIELLVVVAIIGILSSILLPSLTKARYAAYTASCINNLKSIAVSFHLYSDSSGDSLPYHPSLTSWSVGGHNYGLPDTESDIKDYMDGIDVYYNKNNGSESDALLCPGFMGLEDKRGKTPFSPDHGTPTNVNNNSDNIRTYRMNDWLAYIPDDHNWSGGFTKNLAQLSEVRDTSSLIVATEGHGKNLMMKFGELYYNPTHKNLSPAARSDGSVKLYNFDPGSSGFMWSPNSANSTYAVETWGVYLHPEYSGSY